MNIEIRDHFMQQWKKYFNNADLPITFYYTDDPGNANVMPSSAKRIPSGQEQYSECSMYQPDHAFRQEFLHSRYQ